MLISFFLFFRSEIKETKSEGKGYKEKVGLYKLERK